jgi:chondroitin 4-sulfotransferase 11
LTAGRLEAEFGRLWSRIVHHIAPYWLWCATCQPGLRPHIILKLETVDQDVPALVRLLNLTSPAPMQGIHMGTPFEKTEDLGVHSKHKVEEYFSQLTKRQVMDLYEMYRLDHELFGYSPEPYITIAKD